LPFRPIRPPELLELETFVMCAVEGSFGAAAEKLHVSRPAVSKRITHLETLAGKALFERRGRGVRLTEAGARLLGGARRMLEERDVIVGLLAEIRQDGPSPIAGLRALLGSSSENGRGGQLAEARLAETERILEEVLRASTTGVAISDPDTSVLHEVNDAFCRFVGRTRRELIGKPASETGTWDDIDERAGFIEELRRTGSLEKVVIRVRRPDGSTPAGETSARLISVAGQPMMLSTVDDITHRRRLSLQQHGTLVAYRAITSFAGRVLAGEALLDGLAGLLPELRRSAEFPTVLLWDERTQSPTHQVGDDPWQTLAADLARGRPMPNSQVRLLIHPDSPESKDGYAVALPEVERSLIILAQDTAPDTSRALVATALTDLSDTVSSLAPHAHR